MSGSASPRSNGRRRRVGPIGLVRLKVLISIALVTACVPADQPAVPQPHPNLLLVSIDALRADALGSAGYRRATTPELDRLAASATLFRQAVSSFQGTTASMPSLMSGRFPSFHGVESWSRTTNSGFADLRAPGEKPGYPRALQMLAEVLRANGYTTAGLSTNPHLAARWNFNQGFEHYDEFEELLYRMGKRRTHDLEHFYPTADVVVEHALAWLDAPPPEPWFLWLHFMDVHSPYLPPAPYDRLFDAEYSQATDLEINEALYQALSSQVGLTRSDGFKTMAALGLDQTEFAEHLRALYDGSIRFTDAQLGVLLDALRERGLDERTLIAVTADHGEEFFEHGNVIHHRLTAAAEELLRIPLVIKAPASIVPEPVAYVDALVRMVDVAPTLLDLAGLAEAIPDEVDGVSLRAHLEGRSMPPLTAFISYIDFDVVRTDRWKYRRSRHAGGETTEQLFAISADPLEARDVASEHPDELADLRGRYDAFLARSRERGRSAQVAPAKSEAPGPELQRRLEALGYVGED